MSQVKERFLSFILQPVRDLDDLKAGEQAFTVREIQDFLPTVEQPDQILRELTPLLTRIDGFRAAMLALICGVLVEQGGNPLIPIDATMNLLDIQLTQVHAYVELPEELPVEQLFAFFPGEIRAHFGLKFTYMAAMTMLSRDKDTRKRWQRKQELLAVIEKLQEKYDHLFYLKEILSLLDDKELLVLDPVHKRGFHVRLEGVRDRMYHCFALLQHALLKHVGPGYLDARPTDPDAVRYAQNQGMTHELYQRAGNLDDEQRFSFLYPGALNADLTIHSFAFFPGSASFKEIPVIDGLPVLLIDKKAITFHWQPANMYPILHDALTSKVEIICELTTEEVDHWLRKMVTAP